MTMLDSAFSSLSVDTGDTSAPCEAPPAPAKKGRATKARTVKAPPVSLFQPAASGGTHWIMPHVDTDAHQRLTLIRNGGEGVEVEFVGENDRTLPVVLAGRRGAEMVSAEMVRFRLPPGGAQGVPAAQLREVLEFVSLASSIDPTRVALHGVYFDGARVVATDGHRMHLVSDVPQIFAQSRIVPSWAIETLMRAIRWTKAETVWVSEQGSMVYFEAAVDGARVTIAARCVDGRFPDYTQVIPSTESLSVYSGDAAEIRANLKAAPVMGDRCTGRRLDFCADGSGVMTQRHDRAAYRTGLTGYAEKAFHAVLNARYIDHALAELDGVVTVCMADDWSPLRIDNGTRLAIIMPMRA